MILVDIKMPKNCVCCPMSYWYRSGGLAGCDVVSGKRFAITDDEEFKETDGRPSWCPIKCEIEIKEG